MKSAVREIRKDNSFLSKLKYHEQAKRQKNIFIFLSLLIILFYSLLILLLIFSDAERRNKVKQIYSWGANQAHEINKLAKKNKKQKFYYSLHNIVL